MELYDNCQRCTGKTHGITTMSMFNNDILCMPCKNKEVAHPLYGAAVDMDNNEIKKGNYNFEGMGLPNELKHNAEGIEVAKEEKK